MSPPTMRPILIRPFLFSILFAFLTSSSEVIAQDLGGNVARESSPGDDNGPEGIAPGMPQKNDTLSPREQVARTITSSAPLWIPAIYVVLITIATRLSLEQSGIYDVGGGFSTSLPGLILFAGTSAFVSWLVLRVSEQLPIHQFSELIQVAILAAALLLVHALMLFGWFQVGASGGQDRVMTLTKSALIRWFMGALISGLIFYFLMVAALLLG